MKKILACIAVSLVVGGLCGVLYAQEHGDKTDTASAVAEYKIPAPALQTDNAAAFWTNLFKFGFALVFIIVLIYLAVYLLNALSMNRGPVHSADMGFLEVVDSHNLGHNKTIYLFNVYNKRLLILSSTEKEVRVLDTIDDNVQINEILEKIKEKWTKTNSFKDHFLTARRKMAIQESLKGSLNGLNNFFRSFKK